MVGGAAASLSHGVVPSRVLSAVPAAAGALATLVAVTSVVEATARNDRGDPHGVADLTVVVTVALMLVPALGATMWLHHTGRPAAAGALLAASAIAVVPTWASTTWPPPVLAAAFTGVLPLAVPALVAVVARWDPRRGGAGPSLAVTAVSGTAVLVHLAVYDPFRDPGCATRCPDAPTLAGALPLRESVAVASAMTVAAVVVGIVVVTRRRAWVPVPVVATVVAGVVLVGVAPAVRVWAWGDPAAVRPALLLPQLAVGAVAVAVLARAAATRRAHATLHRLVGLLDDPERALRESAAPGATVHVAVPGEDRWVDLQGHEAADLTDVAATVRTGAGRPVIRLVSGDRGIVDVAARLTAAERLVLGNAAIGALTRAYEREVRASQQRIVRSSDAELRRIERDLHDGAQQRLVSAKLFVGIARSAAGEGARGRLDRADLLVGSSLAGLRTLAHGVTPRLDDSEELVAALEDLADASPIDVRMDLDIAAVSGEVAAAAHATVAAALRAVCPLAPSSVHVEVHRGPDALTVRVTAGAAAALPSTTDLVDAGDRVGAAGGHLVVMSGPPPAVVAEIPCASS